MNATRPDHAREIRYALTDPYALCARLELLGGHGTFKRQAGGVIIRCPSHKENTPSCSVRIGPDGTIAWKCFGCQAGGDALSLIAIAHGMNARTDFRRVLVIAAEIANLHDVANEISRGAERAERPAPKPPAPQPERTYPPFDEVSRIWDKALPVTDDAATSAYLTSRALDPETVAMDDLARVIREDAVLPRWASYERVSWTKTGHRLVVPMFDYNGALRSVRGCRIIEGKTPKRLPPGGHKATAIVMACPNALAMLRGNFEPSEVVIVEGEPDFLTWATRKTTAVTARIGIITGSWTLDFARRCPRGASVWIRTDHDAAGNKYADLLQRTLRWSGCFVRRGGRADG